MPDWFYRTVARPLLFKLPAPAARDFALGFMGRLARCPLGTSVIDLLGHMRADPRLRRMFADIAFPGPVGLGVGIDADAIALPALARFGVGFLEVGPVTVSPLRGAAVERRLDKQALCYPAPHATLDLASLLQRLKSAGARAVPLLVRLGFVPGCAAERVTADCQLLIDQLATVASVFVLGTSSLLLEGDWNSEQWDGHLREVVSRAKNASVPREVFLSLSADAAPGDADRALGPALTAGVRGVVIEGVIRIGGKSKLAGPPACLPARQLVQHLRSRWSADMVIIAGGGIHEPVDALEILDAGANLIEIDSGLIYSGPGLPKRINEAILFEISQQETTVSSRDEQKRWPELSWFWSALMGTAMLFGGFLAIAIAATRVVLPYDEAYVGMTRDQFAAVNDRLLAFMAHDRVSLAGTMIAVGVLYLGLSLAGVRHGLHWAWVAVSSSALSGFASFFLFLGFGYFDPFHAFVTAVLFQFLVLSLHASLLPPVQTQRPNVREDWRWRWNQWGQLLFVLHGVVLTVAGLTISWIGITRVFVPEDLEFMRTTARALETANPRLLPLIAHDRATFGGMLIAVGVAVLLSALWGFRQGSRWLWWTLLGAGLPAYTAAIGVHLVVGYNHVGHLAPALSGLTGLIVGLEAVS